MTDAPMQKTRLFMLTFCHFLVDTYATMLAPILPLIKIRLELTNAAAGVLGTIVALIGMSQPLLGMFADRMHRGHFVIVGVVLAAVFTPMLGLAPSFATTVLALALGGIGVAAFHPSSFAIAGDLSGTRRAFGLALFIFGGTMALGLTPLWITRFAGTLGLRQLPWLTVPGLVIALAMIRTFPDESPHRRTQSFRGMLQVLAPHRNTLLLITGIVTLRSITSISFSTFLAVLEYERGVDASEAGRIPLSIYLISGVVGSLVAGYLADRVNPKPLVWGGILLSAPLLYGYLALPEGWAANMPVLAGWGEYLPRLERLVAYVLLGLGGAMILSSNSVLVALAQETAPNNASMVSSLPQGFAWGLGGMFLPLVGHIADHIGMQQTLSYLALLPVGTAALALLLPSGSRRPGPPA